MRKDVATFPDRSRGRYETRDKVTIGGREDHMQANVAAYLGIWKSRFLILLTVMVLCLPLRLHASDHADPIILNDPEANITGLFFFPDGDDMILILNVRRALRNPKPYRLSEYLYQIHMDFSTPVMFHAEDDLARYGGTIEASTGIKADATINIKLKDDTSIDGAVTVDGKEKDRFDVSKFQVFSGVRDDPFIFPRFFEVNVISMALRIPKSQFQGHPNNYLIMWATSSKDGKQLDHVGRSLRSQLPRFGFLNELAPMDQIAALMEQQKKWDGIYNFFFMKRETWSRAFAELIETNFKLRSYDMQPDVMIYNFDKPAGFPNGRRLEDDVVALLCATGDCLLQELSFIEQRPKDGKPVWPRKVANDIPLPGKFPFTAEPWPDKAETLPTTSIWPYIVGGLIVVALVFWGIVEILRQLLFLIWRRLRGSPTTKAVIAS
ncbi:DUF4331 domain-containing protein [Rhizobium leguminosarum]|uniref:DUF4331 domain-containing protein n=1 Tax=Rhizobium leguminosarum TaxID=384 RepID=UPI0014418353|nr:DUF4331 domain-containing protein [Rhizobium leguminosarum]NKL66286.1 hypothetical protein [Rhizobium leguminosarum bv. viciae]